MSSHTLSVDAAHANARVDVFVGEALKLSRAKVKSLFEEGLVKVNGKRVKKGVELAAGDSILVEVPDSVTAARDAQPDATLNVKVLYEDDAVVVVDKPSGMPSQPIEANETGTVANALVSMFPGINEASTDSREAGLCHRLDVETSGVLVAAKTRAAWDAMRAAFSDEGAVDKKYLALVCGPLADEGEIDLPLVHAGNHVNPSMTGDGRPARSSFKTLARVGAFAFVEVTIATGVLHQVRAHLAAVGAPIVGDALYGGLVDPLLGRFFLHAASLAFPHPVTQQPLQVSSPLPTDLAAALVRYGLEPPR